MEQNAIKEASNAKIGSTALTNEGNVVLIFSLSLTEREKSNIPKRVDFRHPMPATVKFSGRESLCSVLNLNPLDSIENCYVRIAIDMFDQPVAVGNICEDKWITIDGKENYEIIHLNEI